MSEPQMILFEQIRNLVDQARGRAARAVNQTMTETYWHIGRLIVEEEQGGESRAVYGVRLIPELSRRLTQEYGKGFSETNLKTFRQFYLAFPIRHALSDESADSLLFKYPLYNLIRKGGIDYGEGKKSKRD